MRDSIKKLFADYEKAFNSLDVEKQVPLFAEHFISAGPKGSIALGRISNEYSMIKVHWGVTFMKTGNRLIEFDVTYFVQKTGSEPKIIMFITHQDEEKSMKDLGLLG